MAPFSMTFDYSKMTNDKSVGQLVDRPIAC